ncbi:hypothetical protein Sjap_006430 [Stephania japonica]|uniref:FAD linked oxidase N-terminal domain-containing protein n=1 Tax=Stephania japonica TaxID=461633 RepID=A0AAP0PJQ9_9MAGN
MLFFFSSSSHRSLFRSLSQNLTLLLFPFDRLALEDVSMLFKIIETGKGGCIVVEAPLTHIDAPDLPSTALGISEDDAEDELNIIRSLLECHMELKVRSNGHDYEGISYVSDVPFNILIDLFLMNPIDVDVKHGSAWVEAGGTLGEVYYNIANKSKTYGFPAGICPTVGVGVHQWRRLWYHGEKIRPCC